MQELQEQIPVNPKPCTFIVAIHELFGLDEQGGKRRYLLRYLNANLAELHDLFL